MEIVLWAAGHYFASSFLTNNFKVKIIWAIDNEIWTRNHNSYTWQGLLMDQVFNFLQLQDILSLENIHQP